MGSKNSATINKFTIHSRVDSGKSVDVRQGNPLIEYRESVFDSTVRVSGAIIDTGNAGPADDGSNAYVGTLEYLQLRGTEKVEFHITDAVGNSLDFGDKLRLGAYDFQVKEARSTSFLFELISKDVYANKDTSHSVKRRYDGKISDSVVTILVEDLETEEEVFFDETINTNSDFGLSQQPFDVILDLQQIATPTELPDALTNTGGYYFWQTSTGYHFRSPDKIVYDAPQRESGWRTLQYKKYLYDFKVAAIDNPPPAGYYDKILRWDLRRVSDTEAQMEFGAIGGVLTDTFDPATWDLNIAESNSLNNQEAKSIFGGEPTDYGEYSQIFTSHIVSELSVGNKYSNQDTIEEQQEKSKEQNYEVEKILPNVAVNYRQKVDQVVTATVPGDFSLHAGDLLWCDVPEDSTKNTLRRSPKNSGIYMILELCHHITPEHTYTALILARDTFGLKTS